MSYLLLLASGAAYGLLTARTVIIYRRLPESNGWGALVVAIYWPLLVVMVGLITLLFNSESVYSYPKRRPAP